MKTARVPFAVSVGLCSLILFRALPSGAADPFAENVRTTEPLSAADQQKSFQLPPGFEIQLVASEPDIQKPLNMAFDERGRLWITETIEYPHPVALDKPGRDKIKILEDTNGDGRADKITTFADGLNIPMGILPYRGGAIAFSIPHIWHLQDTDGDGRADRREKLYGPMGWQRNTHGLCNAFRRGFDGWVYACHGFNNETTVRGADGHTIQMQSGNTFRFRIDGSRIEHFTHGQVNPFGMALDSLGNLFTADCHSKPIYQLLRGGHYPSFGKPDDGLGFVPPMMEHLHGSTAISGLAYYTGRNFPEAFRGNLFSGNVMTSRVNRDVIEHRGSTIVAHERPDFVSTTDPWFRPVDIQVGPDGALYIADFYNRIIGHYEVPLDHPGRDRHRGRIRRIVYTGKDADARSAKLPSSLASATLDELIEALKDPQLTHSTAAMNQLVDRLGRKGIDALAKAFRSSASGMARAQALWALHRLGAADAAVLSKAASDSDRAVRVHGMKVLSETADWNDDMRKLALAGLRDSDAFAQRAAADALGRHPHQANVRPLLDLLAKVPQADNHLRHTVRMALRNQLLLGESFAELRRAKLSEADARTFLPQLALAAPTSDSASYLLDFVQRYDAPADSMAAYLRHAARYIPTAETDALVQSARRRLAGELDGQLTLLSAVQAGLAQRGAPSTKTLDDWAGALAGEILDAKRDESRGWTIVASSQAPGGPNPWVLQRRDSADGKNDALLLCSLPRGEQFTGTLRSPAFTVPPKLSFFAAGHIGYPDRPVVDKNYIRLRDAKSGALLAEARPPRNDIAQRIEWDLARHAGKQGYLELIDGDDAAAYAWLAVGRFSPDVAALPTIDPGRIAERRRSAAALAGTLKRKDLGPKLARLLASPNEEAATRETVANSLAAIAADSRLAALAAVIGDATTPANLREATAAAIGQTIERGDARAIDKQLAEAARAVSFRMQTRLAVALAGDKVGGEALLTLVHDGHVAPRVLLVEAVRQRLLAAKLANIERRLDELTANLPSESQTLTRLIAQRAKSFPATKTSIENGQKVFAKHCAACHQIDGQGSLVGPQLDGIGNRGLERLLEDVLDPNRNVDVAFRSTSILKNDGTVVTGLVRRQEGDTLVLADERGQEFTVSKSDVDRQTATRLSLMPENIAREVAQQDQFDLVAYLLSQRGPPAKAKDRSD